MMKKIRAKYEKHVFLLMMTLVMGLSISFIKTVQVQGRCYDAMVIWFSFDLRFCRTGSSGHYTCCRRIEKGIVAKKSN